MTFTQLLAQAGAAAGKLPVRTDSRVIRPGDVFVAVKGVHADGHDFIPEAIRRGASYIVCENPPGTLTDQPANTGTTASSCNIIIVENSSAAAGLLAQACHNWPGQHLTNLAVTGTNGKTTTTYLVRSILNTAGFKCALIGTIAYDDCAGRCDAPLTTPDAFEIARISRQAIDAGASYLVIEASSHALSQDRLAGIDFTAAAFTNLTGDHLDYHKTPEDYLAAKTKLFTSLPAHATAVLNAQSPVSSRIAAQTKVRKLWYAVGQDADISAQIISMDHSGTVYDLTFGWQKAHVHTVLAGMYNISNHLAAAGLAIAAGVDLETIGQGLSALKHVPGRLEGVDCGQDFTVLVDYAHTDDALRNVLDTLKPICRGKIIVVFGCGGDRDRTKRPRMAWVAEQSADIVIVTSDNPRTEDPNKIIDDIMAGFERHSDKKIIVEPDRKKAVGLAIALAKTGDIVLIAGKGHETYQIVGTQKTHFSDTETAEQFLRDRLQ